jgi:hypothetical protein
MIAEGFRLSVIAHERLDAPVTGHVHHLEEVGAAAAKSYRASGRGCAVAADVSAFASASAVTPRPRAGGLGITAEGPGDGGGVEVRHTTPVSRSGTEE